MAINYEIRRLRLKDLREQEVNARFMRKEQYDTLVRNVKRDGCLTSVPLAFQPAPDAPLELISGHHRRMAAMEALGENVEADVMVILDEQSRQEIVARQISHNAIAGEDDPATLRQLYDSLDDVDWRDYSGLDDQTLGLIDAVDLSSLAEANLEFTTVQIVFLPSEKERAEKALEEARAHVSVDARWLAQYEDAERTYDALTTARYGRDVGNVAVSFAVILDVFEAHIDDLRAGWYDEHEHQTSRVDAKSAGKWVPITSLFGMNIPAEVGAVVAQAIDRMVKAEDVNPTQRWQALEQWAADYLAGQG